MDFFWLFGKSEPMQEPYTPKDTLERKVYELVGFYAEDPKGKLKVRPEHSLIEDLNYDSLCFKEFVLDVEDGFDITIPDEDVEKLSTVQQVVDYIRQRTKTVVRS